MYMKRKMGRYISFDQEVEIEIDLYDIIDEIVELYKEDIAFKKAFFDSMAEETNDFLILAERIRKDDILWERVKYSLMDLMKEDYIKI